MKHQKNKKNKKKRNYLEMISENNYEYISDKNEANYNSKKIKN